MADHSYTRYLNQLGGVGAFLAVIYYTAWCQGLGSLAGMVALDERGGVL